MNVIMMSTPRSCLVPAHFLGFNVDLFGDRPDETDPLPRHGHPHLVGLLASGDELSVAFAQAHLSLPAEVLQVYNGDDDQGLARGFVEHFGTVLFQKPVRIAPAQLTGVDLNQHCRA